MNLSQQLQNVNLKLELATNQNKEVQQSISVLENEKREIQKEIDLEIINSSVFLDEIKKLNFQLYLDFESPKLFNEVKNYEEYPILIRKVWIYYDDLMDRQIYQKENIHFEFGYRTISIHSKSMKDLLEFAKKHKLKWIDKTSKILNEEIVEVKNQLNNFNKIKRLMEKYK